MFVYNPKTLYHIWPAFYAMIDFIIRMINEDKIEVKKSFHLNFTGDTGGPAQFDIWLIGMWNTDLKEQLKVSFAYMPSRGRFVGTVTPIQRFEFSLTSGIGVLFQAESRDPESYDKMLELFKAVMGYLERHDPAYHKRVLESVEMDSLERKNWKKPRKDIEKEVNEKWETRKAVEDFQRERERELSELTNEYKRQGYLIIS